MSCLMQVGDSTTKVVKFEQITTNEGINAPAGVLVILPQRQLNLSKSQPTLIAPMLILVGDSTTKVVKFEQITTPFRLSSTSYLLVILPQR